MSNFSMYDLSEEEESNLPLPKNWIRTIDTYGNSQYRDVRSGVQSEEHPYIIQALDAARKLSLPSGWTVKEAYGDSGEKDYFYFNHYENISGWDPPQLRDCLSRCLVRDGFFEAAKAIKISNTLTHIATTSHLTHLDNGYNYEDDEGKVAAVPSDESSFTSESSEASEAAVMDETENLSESVPSNDVKSYDWMGLMAQIGNDEDMRKGHHQSSFDPSPPDDQYPNDLYYDHRRADIESVCSRSIVSESSRVSVRSRNWMDMKQNKDTLMRTGVRPQAARDYGRRTTMKIPQAVNADSVKSMGAILTELNEQVHELLIELRVAFCNRRKRACNILVHSDVDPIDDLSCFAKSEYPKDVVNDLVTIADGLIGLARERADLLVSCLSVVPHDSAERTLLIYIVLHRVYHPFSTDSSLTTAFLLEVMNFEIDRVCASVDNQMFASDINGLRTLLCVLLTDIPAQSATGSFSPLMLPLFGIKPFQRNPPFDRVGDFPSPTASYSLMGMSLRSYGIRRDVSNFFRIVWRHNIPAIAALTEPTKSTTKDHQYYGPSMSDLLQLAGRIIESVFLDEVMMIFPATATAIARCFADVCGRDGTYTYLLDFLILPNIVKLILGDNDSADNEDVFSRDNLLDLSTKYYDLRNWWPRKGKAFVESENYSLVQVPDPAVMLIWLIWRVFAVSVFSDPAEVTVLTTREFFAPIDVNPNFTDVSDSKVRSIVGRMRMKINKGCGYLLQLPLDSRGSEFLDVQADIAVRGIKIHTQQMSKMLRHRLRGLILKPPEATNATIISRQDSMILFDALAYVLEEQLDDLELSLDVEDLHNCDPFDFAQVLLRDIQQYLYLCDYLDSTLENPDSDVEDIIYLWRRLPLRNMSDAVSDVTFAGSMSHQYPAGRYEHKEQVEGRCDSRDVQLMPPHPPPFNAGEGHEDDLLSAENAIVPPPPSDVDYVYDQLARSIMLCNRYVDSLHVMLIRINTHKACSLHDLLADDTWFRSPEVDVENIQPWEIANGSYDKYTESAHQKFLPPRYGPVSKQSRADDFESLSSKTEKFQTTLRFHGNRKCASNTSLEIFSHKKVVNNLCRSTSQAVDIKTQRAGVPFRIQKKHTKITLPDDSPLLVPTASYSQNKVKRETWQDEEQKFVNSLRSPIVVSAIPDQSRRERVSRGSAESLEARRQSTAVPFPEHLRSRVRGSTDQRATHISKEYNQRFKGDVPVSVRFNVGQQSSGGDKMAYNYGTRRRDRKMPEGGFGLPAVTHVPTESRLNQLNSEENDEDMEITIEQERGWENLLRNYDSRSETSSLGSKPFRPSGSVSPVSLRFQQRRVPRHLRPGKNRKYDNKSLRLSGPGGKRREMSNREAGEEIQRFTKDFVASNCSDEEDNVITMSVNDFIAGASLITVNRVAPVIKNSDIKDNDDDKIKYEQKLNADDIQRTPETAGAKEPLKLARRLKSQESAKSTRSDIIRDLEPAKEPSSFGRKVEKMVSFEDSHSRQKGSDSDCDEELSLKPQSANVSPDRSPAHKRSKPSPLSPVRSEDISVESRDSSHAVPKDEIRFEPVLESKGSVEDTKFEPGLDESSIYMIGSNAKKSETIPHSLEFREVVASINPTSSALGRLNVLSRKLKEEQSQIRVEEECKKRADEALAEAKRQAAQELGALEMEPTAHHDSPRRKLTSSYSFVRRETDENESQKIIEESGVDIDVLCVETMNKSDSGVRESGDASVGETSCSLDSAWKQQSSEDSKPQNISMSSSVFGTPRKVALLKRQNSMTKSNLKGLLMSGYKVIKVCSPKNTIDPIVITVIAAWIQWLSKGENNKFGPTAEYAHLEACQEH